MDESPPFAIHRTNRVPRLRDPLPDPVSLPAGPDPIAAIRARPHNILVVMPSAHPGFLRGLARCAREHNWRLTTDMCHTGVMPSRWDGDGMLVLLNHPADAHHLAPVTELPCVTVNLGDDCKASPRVEPDYAAIGALAARHLLERACRHFIWAPFSEDAPNRECLHGFQSVLQAEGFDCHVLPPAHRRIGHAWHDNQSEWQRALAAQLHARPPAAGLFAFNDCLSAKVVAVAGQLGVSIPGELAVLGAGADPLDCESSALSLSSIDPDVEALTCRAAELLTARLRGEASPPGVVTCSPRGVVTGDSTGLEPRVDGRIHQAVSYVTAHCAEPWLSVSNVAEKIGVSRRQLERDFRDLKGCTIREYIEDARMRKAASLLIEHPRTKILIIAESIGIPDPNSFFRKFRRKYGVTPAAYRRQHCPPDETAAAKKG